MGMPTITVEVAFATNPGATPSWTDLSSRLIRFSVNRGRQHELDAFAAGRAQIVMDNTDRALDPAYTSSPYSPNVVPMRRVRIRAVYNSITYDVFNGYVDNWQQTYDPPGQATCTVQATDAFKVLGNITLPTSAFAVEVAADGPAHWWRLGDTAATGSALDTVTGTLRLNPVGTPTFGASSLPINDVDGAVTFPAVTDGLQGVFAEGTFPFTTGGTIEFLWKPAANQGPMFAVASLGSTITGIEAVDFGSSLRVNLYNNAGGSFQATSTLGVFDDTATHHVMVRWSAGNAVRIYVDGVDHSASTVTFTGSMASSDRWIVALNAVDSPPIISTGHTGTMDEFAIYATSVVSTRVAPHHAAATTAWRGDLPGARAARVLDAAGWPAADRALDTGTSTLQSAELGQTALAALQQIEQTEFGALFVTTAGQVRLIGRDSLLKAPYTTSQATFGDSGAELEYGDLTFEYDDQTIYNEAQVSRSNGSVQTVTDPASITKYLRRTRVVDGLLHQDDSTSRDAANWIVTHYKDPVLRVTGLRLEPSAGNETTHFSHVLGRELMDRVTVVRRPQNLGSAITQPAQIQGVSHTVTATEWVTDWNLSPAETQVYWILGTAGFSELDQTTRLGF